MRDSEFFADQLRLTTEQLIWSARQIPVARRDQAAPGRWSAARILYHIADYERLSVVPSMRLWEDGPEVDDSQLDDQQGRWDRAWRHRAFDDLISDFVAVRDEQIALATRLVGRWDEERDTPWTLDGAPPITLRWVVIKTLQHTFEHSDELLRIRLFWDMHEPWLKSRSSDPRDP